MHSSASLSGTLGGRRCDRLESNIYTHLGMAAHEQKAEPNSADIYKSKTSANGQKPKFAVKIKMPSE